MARILAIEDSVVNLRLTTLMLETAGHFVLQARDASSGLELARSESPDLILLDIHLPGMSGLEAVGLLKSDTATCAIPVVALTARAMKGDEEQILGAGCDGYIAKPLHYADLWRVVSSHLAEPKEAAP